MYPNPQFGSLSLGKAGLRSLAHQLHEALKPEGVYAGTIIVNGYIQPDSPTHSPKIVADKFWELYSARQDKELQY